MMRKIIKNSKGHSLRNHKVLEAKDIICVACSQGKLIIRPSSAKIGNESLNFLKRIQGDICGPIHPSCGLLYGLIDASTRWSHVCLLSSRNIAFARLLAQLIRLRAHFPDFPIKTIRLDNAGEFTSQTFNDYCMSIGISVEHSVAHVHTQNRLTESLIKRIQMVARPMIMKAKLPVYAWGHAVLHAATLIRIGPTSYHTYSPLQLVFGQVLNISYLRIFGYVVYVPIAPPQRTKMRPQRRMGIYVGYDSPSIIRYLEPSMENLFTTRFADCHFDESVFQTLGRDKKQLGSEISWNELSLSHLDPRTKECEQEVQRIIHLQRLANQLPDAFTNLKRIIKSHIPAANAPVKIDVPKEHSKIANESKARLKRGRPIGSKDKNPRKKKGACNQDGQVEVKETLEGSSIRTLDMTVQEEPRVPENEEISINYVMYRKIWNRNEIDIDDTFAYNVALEVMENDEDHEPKLDLCLMDVVRAYLYGSLDTEIFMKLPDGFKVLESCKTSSREQYAIKLNKSLYGLKQSGRMWYNRLSEYLLKEGYKNDSICPCIFIKRTGLEYVIIAVYVDGLNIIKTPGELPKAVQYLKKVFEMKDLEKQSFVLDYK
ncbi:copia protein [Tanacetum coccineum]